jgi:hypothetical protein
MRFEFYPLRFEFIARGSLYFPPRHAANILRGALGVIFRRIACVPGCPEAGTCEDSRVCGIRQSCPYARVFEPVAQGTGPSGLADWPRPFVFRARHLDGKTIQTGQSFHFDLHVFSLDSQTLAYFILTFAALACEGLGPQRGKAELRRVLSLCASDENAAIQPTSLDLNPDFTRSFPAPRKIRVDFHSPTELKHENRIAQRPEFPVLFARIRDRIGTLRTLYGPGPLEIDFQAVGRRAKDVTMTRCEVRRVESARRSSRSGQTHSIGGFVGTAEYEGDLAEFLPYLEAARWVGVGRQAVWGKGEIALTRL